MKNLKLLRKQRLISQSDLASKVGVNQPLLSGWERGTGRPSGRNLQKLAQVLGVSMEALIGDKKLVAAQVAESGLADDVYGLTRAVEKAVKNTIQRHFAKKR